MTRDDDLEQWADDPLVRALRAPGTPDELANADDMTAAFRARHHQPAGVARGRLRRIGLGTTATVLAVAVSGGVAAAYTRALPDPVQRVAHGLLSSVGVPPAPATTQHAGQGALRAGHAPDPHHGAAAPAASASPVGPVVTKNHPSSAPGASHPRARTSPTPAASAAATAGPTSTPTPAPTATARHRPVRPPAVRTVTASNTPRRVAVDTSVTVTGVATSAAGAPAVHRLVTLQVRPAGATGWDSAASGRSAADGSITLSTAGLSVSTRVRLHSQDGVVSRVQRVAVVPTLGITQSRRRGSDRLLVTAIGGEPGDTVTLQKREGTSWVSVADNPLDGADTVTTTVRLTGTAQRYRVQLEGTRQHTSATRRLRVAPKQTRTQEG